MASSNPVFSNPAFQEPGAGRRSPGAAAPTAAQATATQAATDTATTAHLEGMYSAPAAGAIETGRMTVEDTVIKTLGLFAILLVTAVAGWIWTMSSVPATGRPNVLPWIIGAIGGFVMALVVIFGSRTKVRPPLIFLYAAFQGLFIGGISAFFEFIYPGIVVQATLATLAVVGVTLALFASGKIRASARATKIFLVAMVGYLVFGLVNLLLMVFNAPIAGGAFGLYSVKLFGWLPLGVVIGVFVVILAAYSLVLDFDSIQQGVRNGAARQHAWLGAFGIMVTVVWLYLEILRILALLRGNG
ncbi:Bax inhibitor-1/YccA family protein [Microbacterium sp. X-17]|uniref:Bax inhibitor-1/YccA family protein n=1 Tax=Microbacterium sp. X-17 TaxID=3144404 RepID=UPI0031F52CB8